MRVHDSGKNSKQFQHRIVLVSICCTLVAILLAAAGMYQISHQSINTVSHEFLSRLVRQVSLNIDDNITQINSLLINVELDPVFDRVLAAAADPEREPNLSDVRELQQKLLQTQLIRNDIHGFYVFDKWGQPYYCSSAPSLRRSYDISSESWFSALQTHSGAFMLGSHRPERYLLDDTEVVSLVQRIADLHHGGQLATLVVDIKLDMFDDLIATLELTSDCVILILDPDGGLVYSNYGTDFAGTSVEEIYEALMQEKTLLQQQEGELSLPLDARTLLVNHTTSAVTGWKAVCCADLMGLTQISDQLRKSTFSVIIMACLLTLLCVVLITRRQFRTLNRLKDAMDVVRQGSYDVQIHAPGNNEISQLCDTFDDMVERLNYLINTVERLEREKQDVLLKTTRAELDALQAQINPHFIYNALETISMMAEINDDEEAGSMATALGKLIRTSIKGERIITVEEELAHLKNYLLIQSIRFDEKFQVTFDVEAEILQCQIPKLILQPLVENSIHHGLEMKSGQGHIAIVGKAEGNCLRFSIRDDGVGMDTGTLQQLQQRILDYDTHWNGGQKGIGIANVSQRIRLYFADPAYGVQIFSTPGVGTEICVNLPLRLKRKEEEQPI